VVLKQDLEVMLIIHPCKPGLIELKGKGFLFVLHVCSEQIVLCFVIFDNQHKVEFRRIGTKVRIAIEVKNKVWREAEAFQDIFESKILFCQLFNKNVLSSLFTCEPKSKICYITI
jgi:hypothetical protein